MAGSSVCVFTLARCHRLSSSTRCLIATCAPTCRCCILQPPQAPSCRPKCGQRGRTRCDDSRCTAVAVACSQLFFLRWTVTLTHSPGSAPSTNTTLPSGRRATPCASMSSDSICSQPSGCGAGVSLSLISRLSQARRSRPGGQVFLPVRLVVRQAAERVPQEGDLLGVLGLGEAAAHLLEAAVHQIRVHHVRLAVAPDVLQLPAQVGLV